MMTGLMSFDSESDFLAAFPGALWYCKAYDPRFPTFMIELFEPIAVKKPWGPGGAVIEVDCNPETHVLLVNTATGECYPCKVYEGKFGALIPVGYVREDAEHSDTNCSFVSEPVLAIPTAEAVQIQTFEGVHEAPAGAWLCFSAANGLYHVTADKWAQMGYAPLF